MGNLLLLGALTHDPYNAYKVIAAMFKWGMRVPMDEYNNANTSFVYHNNTLLVLSEVAKPIEVDALNSNFNKGIH
jgi:carotenoid cleavage dioxygenase-like enzyme